MTGQRALFWFAGLVTAALASVPGGFVVLLTLTAMTEDSPAAGRAVIL